MKQKNPTNEFIFPLSQVDLGQFELPLGEVSMVKFSQRCSHAVEATSSTDKEEIEVGPALEQFATKKLLKSLHYFASIVSLECWSRYNRVPEILFDVGQKKTQ